jgi:hypothetical protein
VQSHSAAPVATVNGWLAAYLSGCARLIGGLPGATVSSTPAAIGLLVLCAAGAGALHLNRRER